MSNLHNLPLAAAPLTSYRYKGQFGYIMIGAFSIAEAIEQAKLSTWSGMACRENLEVWDEDAGKYVAAGDTP